jgi:hypothetical protein
MAGLLASMEANPDRRPTDFEVAEELYALPSAAVERFIRRFRQLEEARVLRNAAQPQKGGDR